MEEWTLIETVQPPIYVRFLKQTDQDYYFESSAVPYEGWSTPSSTPERYAGGKGAVGDTITLGQKTVRYDFSPPLTETVAYLRFKVVSYDEPTNTMTIRLEATPPPTQSIEGD